PGGTPRLSRRRGRAAQRARRIVLLRPVKEVPERTGFRWSCGVDLSDGLRRLELPRPRLLRRALGDQRREIARFAKRIADLLEIEQEDLLAVADDAVAHETSAERTCGPADVGVIAAVKPVVVLLGQGT